MIQVFSWRLVLIGDPKQLGYAPQLGYSAGGPKQVLVLILDSEDFFGTLQYHLDNMLYNNIDI